MDIGALSRWECQAIEARKWYKIWRERANVALRQRNRMKRSAAKRKVMFWAGRLQKAQAYIQAIQIHALETPPSVKRGEASANARLNADKVRKIRAGVKSDKEFADEFGVSVATIQAAKYGITWAHVK